MPLRSWSCEANAIYPNTLGGGLFNPTSSRRSQLADSFRQQWAPKQTNLPQLPNKVYSNTTNEVRTLLPIWYGVQTLALCKSLRKSRINGTRGWSEEHRKMTGGSIENHMSLSDRTYLTIWSSIHIQSGAVDKVSKRLDKF